MSASKWAASGAIVLALSAQASFSGEPLWDICRLGESGENVVAAYASSVLDGELAMFGLADRKEVMFDKKTIACIPSSAKPLQAAAVLAKYLRENPATLHLPAYILARKAFVPAWPCKK